MNDIDTCPFGEDLNRYWENRFQYFSRFSSGIQMDSEGLHTVVPERIAQQHASLLRGDIILDAFAGVGGVSIAFAQKGKQVIAVEVNQDRLSMLMHNAKIYGVASKITPVCASVFDVIESFDFDSAYFDPPWGFPSRRKPFSFTLSDLLIDIVSLLSFNQFKDKPILLRLPKHFIIAAEEALELKLEMLQKDILNERVISLLYKVSKL